MVDTPNGQKLREHIDKEVEETLKFHTESLKVANEEMGLIKVAIEGIKTDVAWLSRFFWIVAGSSVGGLVTGIMNLLIK